MRISAADFVRQFGRRCDEALTEPVIITRNGRDRLIVMSLVMYSELTKPKKQALAEKAAPLASAKRDVHKQSGGGRRRPRTR